MATIRRYYKIFLLVCLNIFFLFVGVLIGTTPFVQRERRIRGAVKSMMLWARASCAILGIHIHTSGPFIQLAGVFIVCNHCSYTDIPAMGSLIPSVFVSKHEVSSWFLFGRLARLGGTVFVRRESKSSTMNAVKEAKERLLNRINVVIFPEGRTDDGRNVMEFKSSFFKIPLDTDAPILPVSIFYSHVNGISTGLSPGNEMAWHDNRGLFGHFWNLLSKQRIDVKIHFNPVISDLKLKDRKELAAVVCQSVREGLEMLKKEG
jgi:1-acyl-sn-glycerol-3-phosphate acyltransferase